MSEADFKILGIDPGNARLGYALIGADTSLLSCGVIETSKDLEEAKRLAEIRKDLMALIEDFDPDVVSVEKLFFFKNLKTIIPVAQARGVILEVAGSKGIAVYEYTPLQVKQILTGHGRAEKSLVAELVKKEFKIEEDIKPDDAVDAIAIAYSYLRSDHMMRDLAVK